MRRVIAVLGVSAGLSLGQLSSTVSLSNGVEVRIVTSLGQPTGQQVLRVEMARASGESFYRIFKDQNNLVVFAYELAVSRSANGNEFTFTAKPAETEFAARFPYADSGKPVPSLSSEHKLQLRPGEDDEVGLFQMPGMGVSVIDKIQVTMDSGKEPRGTFRLVGLTVSINGGPALGPARTSVSGKYAMFYIPGRGGYFLAIEAPTGHPFLKTGSVDGARLRFTVENENYECISEKPILANSESGDVWVYHDPAYKPEGNWTQEVRSGGSTTEQFFAAASDSLSWWLR